MGKTFAWPIIRWLQRLSMILALGCGVYVIFYFFKNQDDSMSDTSSPASARASGLASLPPVVDLKPYDAPDNVQARDIFSLPAAVNPSGTIENTPKGQLPLHLKVVGILVASPSQII